MLCIPNVYLPLGNPQLFSDLADKKTIFPYLDDSSHGAAVKLQPIKVQESNKSKDAGKKTGTFFYLLEFCFLVESYETILTRIYFFGDATSTPTASQLSPRQWTNSVSKKNKVRSV